jgi:hypothetical protein
VLLTDAAPANKVAAGAPTGLPPTRVAVEAFDLTVFEFPQRGGSFLLSSGLEQPQRRFESLRIVRRAFFTASFGLVVTPSARLHARHGIPGPEQSS